MRASAAGEYSEGVLQDWDGRQCLGVSIGD